MSAKPPAPEARDLPNVAAPQLTRFGALLSAESAKLRRQVLALSIAAGVLIIAALVATIVWLGPLPPRVVVVTTGTPGSDYDLYAQQYRAILKRSGVELRLMPSAGGVENLKRLNDPHSGVSVGFAQGGLTNETQSPDLTSLGVVSYQPFWLFIRGEVPTGGPDALRGKKLAVGPEGSGTRALTLQFLALNGIDQNVAHLLPLTAEQAADALQRGDIDGAAMVESWDSRVVRRLLGSSEVSLVGFPRADAYVALHPFLTKLVVPMGVGNMATNRPTNDVAVVAPEASLLIRRDLHPSVQYLLLEAATQVHSVPGMFQKAGQFPAGERGDLPIAREARQFYKSGPPFLQRYLPFWLAVFASRMLVLLIPVIGVAYPLLRFAPAIYSWSMRRRIFRLYGQLRYIEMALDARQAADTHDLLAQLDQLEARANRLQVPLAFAQFSYQLRNHIGLVRARLRRDQAAA
jgi:TRAP-type uncharacterized transport system substrate-binding protein